MQIKSIQINVNFSVNFNFLLPISIFIKGQALVRRPKTIKKTQISLSDLCRSTVD